MTILCLLISVAILWLVRWSSRGGNGYLLSPVSLVGWFGILYLLAPVYAIGFGIETKWAPYMAEAKIIAYAMPPFLTFAIAALLALRLAIAARVSPRSVVEYRAPVASIRAGVALLICSGAAFLLMVLSGSVNVSFLGRAETAQALEFKFLLALVDLAIPGLAILLFSEDRPRRYLSLLVVSTLLAFILLGSRYRVAMLAILLMATVLLRGGLRTRVQQFGIGALVFMVVALMGLGRSYRQGFDLTSVLEANNMDWAAALVNEANIHLAMGSVVNYVPSFRNYDFWSPILVALSAPIPRALWPDKPAPEYLSAIPASLGVPELLDAGAAIPMYGEWYLMGGLLAIFVIGVVVLSILQIQFERALRYRQHALAATISCFCSYAYTRGYMTQNLTAYGFLVLPAVLSYKRFRL